MALIKCPECGREISDKAASCPGCGCPASEWKEENRSEEDESISNESDLNVIIKKIAEKYSDNEKVKMIRDLRQETGMGLKEAKDAIEGYLSNGNVPNPEPKKEFHGIYRSTLLHGLQEVYCPQCGSEDCSHYQEQRIIPGQTKTMPLKHCL